MSTDLTIVSWLAVDKQVAVDWPLSVSNCQLVGNCQMVDRDCWQISIVKCLAVIGAVAFHFGIANVAFHFGFLCNNPLHVKHVNDTLPLASHVLQFWRIAR